MREMSNTSADMLFGFLKSELGFDLQHGFLATVAQELAATGALSEKLLSALTAREVQIIEECADFALNRTQARAA